MAHELKKADFDTLLPEGVDLRPLIAAQVWKFLGSNDYQGGRDSELAKAERFLRSVERKGYANKLRQNDDRPVENSMPYLAMLKNWGRKHARTKQPTPKGDKKFARGVFYFFFRDVGNHAYFTAVAKQIWKPNDLIFRRLYYAKYLDNPNSPRFSEVCSRYHAESHVVRREFDRIWIGLPIAPSTKVHLGPITIVFGDEDRLNPLSLHEPANQKYNANGMPDIFAALDWRSRLSGFHGRREDVQRLKDWALDETRSAKIVLICGPGGAGKTRLAVDTVAHLVHDHGWCGGFLGETSRLINGDGGGVALIIDYPEERTNLVSEILKATVQALRRREGYDRPVRLILVSRETREAWNRILNEPATFLDEIRLDAHPYLEIEDARAIADDIAIEYSQRLGRTPAEFSGVEDWLERHAVHRLPLYVVAASVHAVLDPSRAFKLDGTDVLTALADLELKRVRYYSERDLGDRDSLEKLLGLSILTRLGLGKETVFELGEKGICPGRTGAALLEAVRKTPFWRSKVADDPSHLIRLEPDRLAAVFCLKALMLDDPSPGLPSWLAPTARQDDGGFGDRLSRVVFDIGYVDPAASRILEQQCITMLNQQPDLIGQFQTIAYRKPLVFSSGFAIENCTRLLGVISDDFQRSILHNNLSIMFSDLGKYEDALQSNEESVSIFIKLAEKNSHAVAPFLAGSITNQAGILSYLGQRKAALKTIKEAISIYRQLNVTQPNSFVPDLASALMSQAKVLSDLWEHEDALKAVEEAISIYRGLKKALPDSFLPGLAASLNSQAKFLSDLWQHEAALDAVNEAISLFRQLANARPDVFQPDVAQSLNTQASVLCELRRREEALTAVNEAVSIHRQLAAVRPDAFLISLPFPLNTQARVLSELKEREVALKIIDEAVRICRQLEKKYPDASLPYLAVSLKNRSKVLFDLGEREAASDTIQEAVSIYHELVRSQPDAFLADLASSQVDHSKILSDLGQREVALDIIDEAVSIYRQLVGARAGSFLPAFAESLNGLLNRLALLGRWEAALEASEEALLLRRQLAAARSDPFLRDLASSLNNHAQVLAELGQRESALKAIDEAVSIRRQLAVTNPVDIQPYLANSLKNRAEILKAFGSTDTTPFA